MSEESRRIAEALGPDRDEAAELRAAVREWAEAEAAYRDALNGFEPSPLTAAIKSLHRATDNLRRLAGMEDET